MKKTLLYLTFIFFSIQLQAQGFNKVYTLGYRYLEFFKSIQENDTLTIFGYVITKDSIPKKGVFISKFDTLGNLISINTYFRPNEEPIYWLPETKFIKTSDNGYVGFLSLGGNNEGLIKFKHNGEVDKVKIFNDNQPNINFLKFTDILEVDNSFIILGYNDQPGKPPKVRIYKVDKNWDNFIWDTTYEDPKWCFSAYFPYLNVKKGIIRVVISKDDECFLPDDSVWSDLEVTLDVNTGAKISETVLPLFGKLIFKGILDVDSTARIFFGEKIIGKVANNTYTKSNILKADKKNNVIWSKIMSDTSWITEVKKATFAKNKDILLAGNTILPLLLNGKYYFNHSRAAVIYRYDQNGNLKWKKVDTLFNTLYTHPSDPAYPLFLPERAFYDVVELSSGSIIACGFTDKYDYDVAKDSIREVHSEAWLYKVDKNGCINSKDCATVATQEIENNKGNLSTVNVFPNPTDGIIHISAENSNIHNIEIYDIGAKRLKEFHFSIPLKITQLELPEANTPIFLIKVKLEDGTVVIKKVAKTR